MIRSFLIAVFLIISNFQSLSANDKFFDGCSACEQSQAITGTVYSPHNKKNIELTILSEDRVKEVFKKIKEDEDIPFNYPYEDCYARAHKAALDLDEMGIVSGKAFVEGEMYFKMKHAEFGWSYHVANLVLVKKGNKLVPTIIDPATFDRPVPVEEWKAFLLKDPKSKKVSEYYTKRFNYDPETRHDDLKNYDEEELENMTATNRSNIRKAEMLEMAERLEAKEKKGKK